MPRRLYPLNALRAFEASARHLSYVKAADELSVTPAAVSHQVKKLEDYLGAQLFKRLTRGLALTDAGQELFRQLTGVFTGLDGIVERFIATEAHAALTISVAPMFAAKWLVPRLLDFETAFPDIDLRISSSLSVIDFARDAFDAAIRIGKGNYPDLEVVRFLDETVTPMCSPGLLDTDSPIETPDDLADHVLLHDDSMAFDPKAPDWTTWFKAAGAHSRPSTRGPRFSQPDHALQAAIDGAGIVLGWRSLARDDLAAGRLVEPFDLSLSLNSSLYLVYPKAYAERQKIKLLRQWLVESLVARDG